MNAILIHCGFVKCTLANLPGISHTSIDKTGASLNINVLLIIGVYIAMDKKNHK